MIKTLKELGWSQENISLAIGVTRPTYKKYTTIGEPLSIEAAAKLGVLIYRQEYYRHFAKKAIEYYTKKTICSLAYKNLADELEAL